MTEVQQRTAEQLFRVLGELKGGAMKFGQALSHLRGGAARGAWPRPYREHADPAAGRRPADVGAHRAPACWPASSAPAWRSRFVEFDDDPAAAASIGQVHRGRLARRPRGRGQGAVPGRRRRAAVRPAPDRPAGPAVRRLVPGIDIKPLVDELQDRVAEELDYRLEAEAQQRVRRGVRRRPGLRRPRRGRAHRRGCWSPSGSRPRARWPG